MNKNYSISLLDPFSLLVVNRKGELRRLHCPFAVRCIEEIENIGIGTTVSVEMVATGLTTEICYRINGKYYQHFYFELKSIG